ncbi:thioredoxin domain-containing protein [Sulfurivirga sp.]|uniref:thioredoxin domain-containing protein n=1 Tax=Sulfurivirga sp. TaxID=2614236 RepID=UPI0025F9BCDF|nr:DUF255 domain-containing protein [Sulfurivirga sp.]
MKIRAKKTPEPGAEKTILQKWGRPRSRRTFIATLLAAPAALANALKGNPSPYLAMHGDNPVDWHLWSDAVLKQAQAHNRLIFISSGYFSCYWCHRMEEDVYLHPDAAAVLNRYTIPVKVDRELDPALDSYLIDFAQRTTGRAGWPIHVLLTPDGLPFYSFLYQPKKPFMEIIERAARLWAERPDEIRAAARRALPHPRRYDPDARPTLKRQAFRTLFLERLREEMDDFSGGLKGQQKFPQSPLLLSVASLNGLPDTVREWLTLTLEQMASRHLRDHVHGGFFRYTVDPEWHTPHYEKMLYDNAQLATLYCRAGRRFDRRDWIDIGLETLHFVEAQLFNPKTGLFFGSLSAVDAHGEEGGNYLWTRSELKRVLDAETFNLIRKAWQLDQPGPWDGKWLPEPIEDPRWPAIRRKLAAAKPQPARDSKQLLGWNALMVEAYQAAAEASGEDTWRNKATELFERLHHLLMGKRPPRALIGRRPAGDATLEDHALLLRAAAVLGRPTDALRRYIERRYLTDTGWKLAARPMLPGMGGRFWLPDDALPSLTALVDKGAPARLAAAEPDLRRAPLASGSYLRFHTLL